MRRGRLSLQGLIAKKTLKAVAASEKRKAGTIGCNCYGDTEAISASEKLRKY